MLNDHVLVFVDPLNTDKPLYLAKYACWALTDNILEATIKPQTKIQDTLNIMVSCKKTTLDLEMWVFRQGKKKRALIDWTVLIAGQVKQINITVI